MDLDHLLLWMVGLSNGLLVLRLGGSKRLRRSGWFQISLFLLACLALIHWRWPGYAGRVVGPVWGLFILAPMLLSGWMRHAILREQFALALALARIVVLLHPLDGMGRHARLVTVLSLLDRGHIEQAKQRLFQLERRNDPMAAVARLMLARAEGSWESFAEWFEQGPRVVMASNRGALAGYLRALGELGRTREMLALFASHGQDATARHDPVEQGLMAVSVAALAGRRPLVDALLAGPLKALPEEARCFWRATTEQVAGRPEAARVQLLAAQRTLQRKPRQILAREVLRRLEQPLPPASPHAPAEQPDLPKPSHPLNLALPDTEPDTQLEAPLDALQARLLHERRFAPLSAGGRRPVATWVLAAVLVIVFLFEIPGGSEDMDNLVRLGALVVPVQLTPGEWWRRLTAGFLHFGPLHLGMNVAGLLLLGQWLERAWGRKRLVACFLLCTFASLTLYPPFGQGLMDDPQIVVGASGGIMGLLGALLGFLLIGRTQGANHAVSQQLRTMLLLVVLQVLFDLSTPMVSSTAHMLGLTTGLITGLIVGRRMIRRPEGGPASTPSPPG